MQDPNSRTEPKGPEKNGKSTAFALAGLAGIALLAVLAIALSRDTGTKQDQIAFADNPSQSRIQECNQYAAQVARESGAIGGPSLRCLEGPLPRALLGHLKHHP